MNDEITVKPTSSRVSAFGVDVLEALSRQFPVCLASDEFHFFPQYSSPTHQWSVWDDFSKDALDELFTHMSRWQKGIRQMKTDTSLIRDDHVDLGLLQRVLSTLQEQLELVCFHQRQPSFYLTLAAIGLVEALENGRDAFDQRLQGLPRFLAQTEANLVQVPEIFIALGRSMADKLHHWLLSLQPSYPRVVPAVAAMERFGSYLEGLAPIGDFVLPRDVYARIAYNHIGCELALDDVARELEAEIDETLTLLQRGARIFGYDTSWQEAFMALPEPLLPAGGVKALYEDTIAQLKDHCISRKMVARPNADACPVTVSEIPDYLLPVRSGAAYSMPPGNPPRGGTFFIMPVNAEPSAPVDFRQLAAHETFPGHHVLDMHRWELKHTLRRSLEFPIFYEGWASFCEELLFDTGFFGTEEDHFLTAKRRFWRAVRGQTDLNIHSGRHSPEQAVNALVKHGMPRAKATTMVRRYTLKPGYQLSYTLGRRKFRDCYEAFTQAGGSPDDFARRLLNQGETDWQELEDVLGISRHKGGLA